MIKLKDILEEISGESKKKLLKEGECRLKISFDGEEILALSKETEEIEVELNVEYSSDEESLSIEGWDINSIVIYGENGKEQDVNIEFLHPQQEKMINNAIDRYVNTHEREMEDKIYDIESRY